MAKQKRVRSEMIVGPEARLAFPAVDEPQGTQQNPNDKKYRATLVFSPKAQETAEFKEMRKAVEAVMAKAFPDENPDDLKSPFLEVDEVYPENSKRKKRPKGFDSGAVFIRSATMYQPGLVDENVQKVLNPREKFYPGCYVIPAIHFFSFDNGGNVGVTTGLDHLQFARDGDPLVGSDPKSVFSAIDHDDEGEKDDGI